MGNVVNRVFDSSGPEGKVRGTPQQVIDKYNQLARDAQLSGDRVAAENFQQHAEHYLRLLGSAQKEQDAKREEQERQNRERQAERDRDRAKRQEREMNGGELVDDQQPQPHKPKKRPQSEVLETGGDEGESGLVETPESRLSDDGSDTAAENAQDKPQDKAQDKPKRARKPRTPRKQAKAGGDGAEAGNEGGGGNDGGEDGGKQGHDPQEATG